MKSCGLALAKDSSDDGLIFCFKKGKKCESGKAMLENYLKIFNYSTLQDDSFVISDQDIVAALTFSIIGEDDDKINIE